MVIRATNNRNAFLFIYILSPEYVNCYLYSYIYSFSFRSTSHTELTRKASSSEKETESVVVLDPVSTSGHQTSENTLNQNKMKEEKSKPLHKETNTEKMKETDSSNC